MKRGIPLAIAVVALGWLGWLWWGRWGEAGATVWVSSAVAVAAAIAGAVIPPARARAHAAVAGVLMLALAGFAFTRVIGRWPFAWDALSDARYAGFIATAAVVVAGGLFAGSFWARWAAMAYAAGSLLGGSLNSLGMRGAGGEYAWVAAMGVIGGAIILVQLGRGEVRAAFAVAPQHALWASRDRLVTWARRAAIANLAAAPMLLLYALGQPVAPATITSALVLAPILLAGSMLVIARRTAGVAVLATGGVALAAHTAASFAYVATVRAPVVGYYAAFWLPAAALTIAAGAIALVRALRA